MWRTTANLNRSSCFALSTFRVQVPFLSWGGPLSPLLQLASVPTAAIFLRKTGIQFFRRDAKTTQSSNDRSAEKPLLLRMTEDDEDRGLYFYSALESFKSRTAYANTGVDG